MGRKFFVGGNWKCNGTSEEVKKIVSTLNDGQVPSSDVVGMDVWLMLSILIAILFWFVSNSSDIVVGTYGA